MSVQSILLEGIEYVVLPRAEYLKLTKQRQKAGAPQATDAVDYGKSTLGAGLRAAREAAGLTQAALARKLRKSQPMVSGAESGRVKVGEDYVKAVLKACGLPSGWSAGSSPCSRSRNPPIDDLSRKG